MKKLSERTAWFTKKRFLFISLYIIIFMILADIACDYARALGKAEADKINAQRKAAFEAQLLNKELGDY